MAAFFTRMLSLRMFGGGSEANPGSFLRKRKRSEEAEATN